MKEPIEIIQGRLTRLVVQLHTILAQAKKEKDPGRAALLAAQYIQLGELLEVEVAKK